MQSLRLSAHRVGSTTRLLSSAAQVCQGAVAAYDRASLNFRKFPLDQLEFRFGEHNVSKLPIPQLFVKDSKSKINGLSHLSPISRVSYPYFGLRGNLNRTRKYPSGTTVVSSLTDAAQEFTLTAEPLYEGAGINQDMVEYFNWLRGVHQLFSAHLAQNYSHYQMLAKKVEKASKDVLPAFIDSLGSSPVRVVKLPSGEEREMVSFSQKIYFKKKDGKINTYCDDDVKLSMSGYQRIHVPLYDSVGKEIDINSATLRGGDVVSVHYDLRPNLYSVAGNVGFNFTKKIRSVTLFHQIGERSVQAPFKDAKVEGGVVF